MISFSFRLKNPFSDRWETVYHKDAMLGTHTCAEIQVVKDNTIVEFSFSWYARQDHAGITIYLGLFGYSVSIRYYDTRHWNDEAGRFYNYDSAGNES